MRYPFFLTALYRRLVLKELIVFFGLEKELKSFKVLNMYAACQKSTPWNQPISTKNCFCKIFNNLYFEEKIPIRVGCVKRTNFYGHLLKPRAIHDGVKRMILTRTKNGTKTLGGGEWVNEVGELGRGCTEICLYQMTIF